MTQANPEGHAAALEILPVRARVGGERWTCPRLPAGADAEVLEVVFSSFLRFLEPMGIDRIVVVLAPTSPRPRRFVASRLVMSSRRTVARARRTKSLASTNVRM
jgi:hypothetical protein